MSGNWLDALKAGDEVIVRSGYRYAKLFVGRVDRRDKIKVVVSTPNRFSEWRFSARSGRELTNGHGPNSLVEPTPELLAEVRLELRRDAALSRIRAAKVDRLPIESLEGAADLLDPPVSSVTSSEGQE